MARLNEPAISTAESIEMLRKKMLRQNRELAKLNNTRALRIRELEEEVSRAQNDNLELRSRINELEQEAREHEERQEHTLKIRKALESQLTDWCTIVGGLGMEPPKRQSPPIESASKTRTSSLPARISPSQRRLRNIANDCEQLGHIAEHKAYSRESMNPEQIQALRLQADQEEATKLPSPSRPARQEPAKADTPPRETRARNFSSTIDSSPLVVSSPNLDDLHIGSTLATKTVTPMIRESRVHVDLTPDTPIAPPTKAGSKRKFTVEDYAARRKALMAKENNRPRVETKTISVLDNARGKTLKELTAIRREENRAKTQAAKEGRMPLAIKSTNDDIQSPKKRRTVPAHDISDADLPKPRFFLTVRPERQRVQEAEALAAMRYKARLAAAAEEYVRENPALADVTHLEETSRPSRRSRAAISYTEPNLRDKMRRPRNETFDAVSGEGKSRRFSHSELSTLDTKRGLSGLDAWTKFSVAHPRLTGLTTGKKLTPF
ncbi:shugoshin [Cordyceps fumosorosea ARSEF 2679]|uniref:Shugoshin n=1 Tax=Cordyceps fumosorosea (strain ARSEF 2679) TaxID=1081104 RepID=A0A168CDY7_CORFA|nr:shugoshin [Cordyceps fumosorosea ARSEF 2679]OAA71267.1 shugoshin [Cordyceps fumosorosea ARSEF 2679]